jgi:hypothetical protein
MGGNIKDKTTKLIGAVPITIALSYYVSSRSIRVLTSRTVSTAAILTPNVKEDTALNIPIVLMFFKAEDIIGPRVATAAIVL